MSDSIYLYSKKPLLNIIKQILSDYKILPLSLEEINNINFKNNNTLIIAENNFTKKINESFFLTNNVVSLFYKKDEDINLKRSPNTHFLYGQTSVKKFLDEIKTHFIFKRIILKNTEIFGEKLTNIHSGSSLFLTPLEKEIMIVLFENKKIKRDYFLEEILKIKKNIETKTIESHLTRIRKKLLKIRSKIQITTKEDVFYLEL